MICPDRRPTEASDWTCSRRSIGSTVPKLPTAANVDGTPDPEARYKLEPWYRSQDADGRYMNGAGKTEVTRSAVGVSSGVPLSAGNRASELSEAREVGVQHRVQVPESLFEFNSKCVLR